jgi:hypothetical protein
MSGHGLEVSLIQAASGVPPASSLPDTPRHTGSTLSRSGNGTSTAVGAAWAVVAAPASRPLGGHRGQGTDKPGPGRSTTPRRRPTTSPATRNARHETNGRRATGRGLLRGSARCHRAPSAGPHVHASLLPSAPPSAARPRAAKAALSSTSTAIPAVARRIHDVVSRSMAVPFKR